MRLNLISTLLLVSLADGCNNDSSDADLLSGGGCKTNPDLCTGDTVCDLTTNRCVACLSDEDCASGACSNKQCVACNTDEQCASGGCLNHTCVECTTDAHCAGNPAGEACNTGTHACVECMDNDDCTTSPAGGVCNTSAHACTCGKDADCATSPSGHLCNTTAHACQCKVATDCNAYPYGQICASNTCAQCASDADCGTGKACITDADKQKRCYLTACVTSAYSTASPKPNWRGIYWGTLHEHTNWSLDAYFKSENANANATYTPQGAYEFAMGHTSQVQDGAIVQEDANNKLDWVAITDHSEFFDTQQACIYGGAESATDFCASYLKTDKTINGYVRQKQLTAAQPVYVCDDNNLGSDYACPEVKRDTDTGIECAKDVAGSTDCDGYAKSMWRESQRLADDYDTSGRNNGCTFATLNAFEYSSNVITTKGSDGKLATTTANQHRNIIFRGPGNATSHQTTVTPFPLDYITYPSTPSLWAALEKYCPSNGTGTCRALAIPHNPNDSAGLKWDVTYEGDGGLQRSKFEKLVEIHQHKGSSECLNSKATGVDGDTSSGTTFDPSCEFELGTTTAGATDKRVDTTPPITDSVTDSVTGLPDRKKDPKGYVRAGLAKGLLAYYKLKNTTPAPAVIFNPFQLGIIGGTDSHNSTPGYTVEKNWHGNTGADDNTKELRFAETRQEAGTVWNTQRYWNAGALTAVHAKRNVREDIWDALNAREAYATSGDRIKLWFFLLPAGDSTLWCARFKTDTSLGYNTAEAIRTLIANDAASNAAKPSGSAMGGTVGERLSTTNPRFVVFARKDPQFTATSPAEETHNLAELDLIQTSVIDSTKTQDLVFRFSNSGGAESLCKIFTTSDTAVLGATTKTLGETLKNKMPHLWYARVLETPIWSWRYWDCEAMGAAKCSAAWGDGSDADTLPDLCGALRADGKCSYNGTCDANSVCTYPEDPNNATDVFRSTYVRIRERAWSSPIWYMP